MQILSRSFFGNFKITESSQGMSPPPLLAPGTVSSLLPCICPCSLHSHAALRTPQAGPAGRQRGTQTRPAWGRAGLLQHGPEARAPALTLALLEARWDLGPVGRWGKQALKTQGLDSTEITLSTIPHPLCKSQKTPFPGTSQASHSQEQQVGTRASPHW